MIIARDLRPWLAWGSVALFYAYQFALRVAPSVMGDDMMRDFSLDAAAFGFLGSCYYYGYAFFQVPAGSLLDLFGTKRVLLSFVLLCLVGVALSMTHMVGLVYLGRFFVGVGSAISFVACVKVASDYFSRRQAATITGLSVFLGTLGAMGGGAPLAYSTDIWGWRPTTAALGVFGGVILVLIFAFIKKDQAIKETAADRIKAMGRQFKKLLALKQTWVVGIYGILMYVPLAAFCDLWGPGFFQKNHGFSEAYSAFLISFMYIGLGVGSPFGGFLARIFKGYRLCFFLSSALGGLLFIALLLMPTVSGWLFAFLLFVIGAVISVQILGFNFVATINPPSIAATATGFHNMLCMMSGILSQPLIGFLMVKFFPTSDYLSLMVIPGAMVLAFLVTFFVSEPEASKS